VSTNLVELRGITKRYPGVTALDGVDFDVRAGEIHSLAGENGAGKSTLMKVLGGAVAPDAGEIRFAGEAVAMRSPRDALTLGISTVHQELVAAHSLSVTENILLGRLPRRMGRVLWAPARQQAREVLDRLGVDLDERTRMDRLSLGQQQLVEIARALVRETRLLVLDEPSAILGQRELEVLYRVLDQLREQGTGIVYISHRLSEVLALSDRVTVLKDGRRQQSVPVTELDEERLVTLMTGRQLVTPAKTPPPADSPVLLSVRDLRIASSASTVDLEVRAGEIVGLAGLVGSGRTEVARGIIGADPAGGTVSVGGRRLARRSPRSCRRAGLGYLPEDRKDSGLLLNRSIRENIGLASLGTRSRFGLLRGRVDRTDVADRARDVRLKAPDLDADAATLSGGNQQKVMLARWLAANPQVLILDEPTRGIDVGGKSEIYRLMRELTQNGQAVLMISSEIEEVLAMSDRVLVMRGGALVAELRGAEITEQAVTRAAIVGPAGDTHPLPGVEAGSGRRTGTKTEVAR
jgi:ribose transport system ATP-binding protein